MATELKRVGQEMKPARDVVEGDELVIDSFPWKVQMMCQWDNHGEIHIEFLVQDAHEWESLNTTFFSYPTFMEPHIKRLVFRPDVAVACYRKELVEVNDGPR